MHTRPSSSGGEGAQQCLDCCLRAWRNLLRNGACQGGKDHGIVFKNTRWWVHLYANGREKWYRCDTKSQAKALYGHLKGEQREGTYFPEKFAKSKDLTLSAWQS
jgi:hypothetical protein